MTQKFKVECYLTGIISELDYVESLGIETIWLSPVYKSPMADFGYDISDFRDVDPIFGTLDDLKELVEGAHERGILRLSTAVRKTNDHFHASEVLMSSQE